jgi:hypothetical protein
MKERKNWRKEMKRRIRKGCCAREWRRGKSKFEKST